jgi:uncharacterized protein
MATDHIRYDLLVQDAFRGIFRKVLTDAASQGLPGEHHFYITFKTHAPGVVLSDRLRAEYPEQMTIILQHQFWDLRVHDSGFEVGLSFRRIPEKLEIPFAAVSGFFDPSVNFGAEFTADEEGDGATETASPTAFDSKKGGPALATLGGTSTRDAMADAPKPEQAAPQPARSDESEPVGRKKPRGAGSEPVVATPAPSEEQPAASETTKVVSIDAFRKKNT